MNQKTKVSVVIPFYNCPYVNLAVESVLAQTYPDIELIVVDDGSTLHSEKLEEFNGKIVYLRKPNGGTASALNMGIRAASGDYFAWLSSDDLFHPDKIRQQMEGIRVSGASFSHTAYYQINALGVRSPRFIRMPLYSRVDLIRTLMRGCPVNGSSVLLDIDIFSKIGLFDESLLYTHDYDMWLRTLPHFEWSYVQQPLLDYRLHQAMGSVIHAKAQGQEKIQVQAKHHSILARLLEKEEAK